MRKIFGYLFGVIAISSALGACGFNGKYEDNNLLFDNNCSGTGGYYDDNRCSDFAVYK